MILYPNPIHAIVFISVNLVSGYHYNCSTPTKYLSNAYNGGQLWPDAQIFYKLDNNLTSFPHYIFYDAVAEYHSKTCVRFVPRLQSTQPFTNISPDSNVCGEATVCRQNVTNFIKFSQNCTTTENLIHQLGHNLCLGHEHQRSDRDQHLRVNSICSNLEKENPTPPSRFYDFASQMHSECGQCVFPKSPKIKFCGGQVSPGLSVLDVDRINQLYNCGGCFRHRWIPVDKLTDDMKNDLPNFNRVDSTGLPLYPCRTFLDEELAIGTYHSSSGLCSIGHYGKKYLQNSTFEVLTVPGGLKTQDSEYYLADGHRKMKKWELDDLFANAVSASQSIYIQNGKRQSGVGYIGYGYGDKNLECSDSDKEFGVIGKVWRFGDRFADYFAGCEKERVLSRALVLSCKPKPPDVNEITSKIDPYKNWKLRYMKAIDNPFQYSEHSVFISGRVFEDATQIYVDICQQVSAGAIQLHLQFLPNSETSQIHMLIDGFPTYPLKDQTNALAQGKNFTLEIFWMDEGLSLGIKINDNETIIRAATVDPRPDKKTVYFLRIHGDTHVNNVQELRHCFGEVGNEPTYVADWVIYLTIFVTICVLIVAGILLWRQYQKRFGNASKSVSYQRSLFNGSEDDIKIK